MAGRSKPAGESLCGPDVALAGGGLQFTIDYAGRVSASQQVFGYHPAPPLPADRLARVLDS
ncbi:hypothetical protein GCM10009609_48540 [Pseudonocardia aurantiaca]